MIEVKRRRDGTLTVRSELPDAHDWPARWVDRNVASGHASLFKGSLILHLRDGTDVEYRILSRPGVYCLGCGDGLGDEPARSDAVGRERADALTAERKAHVADCGNVDDPQCPAGYRFRNVYRTVKEG